MMKKRILLFSSLMTLLALLHISCAKRPLEEQFEDAIYRPLGVSIRTLEKILDKGCPIDYLSYGETIEIYNEYFFSELTSVFSSGYVDLLKEYLENHDVDLFSDIGIGLDYFCCAVISDKPEMVKFILPRYGNINSRRYTLVSLHDKTPIYGITLYGIADAYDCQNSKKTLLEHGADGFLHY